MNKIKTNTEILKDGFRMAKFIQKRIKQIEPKIYYLFKNNNFKNLIK